MVLIVIVIVLVVLLVLFLTSTKIEEAVFGRRLGDTAERGFAYFMLSMVIITLMASVMFLLW